MTSSGTDVFVSYKAEDRARLLPLVKALEAEDFTVWWDAHIGGGTDWREEIQQHLDAARCVIVAWSKRSVGPEGRFVRDEASRAQRRGVYVPILLDKVEPPLGFGETQAISLAGWNGDRSNLLYQALLAAVRAVALGDPRVQFPPEAPGVRLDRRVVLVGGTAAAAGLALFVLRNSEKKAAAPPSPEIEALLRQAELAQRQGTREGENQAIGLYRQVVSLDPQYADGWGGLGIAYGISSHNRASVESASLSVLANAAGQRAVGLQRGNVLGEVALATSLPTLGHWLEIERSLKQSVLDQPHNDTLLALLSFTLTAVGRNVDSLLLFDKIAEIAAPSPAIYFNHIQALWSAGRMEETDAMLARASMLYPTHFAIWFSRFYIAMFSGRIDSAIAMARNQSEQPTGIPAKEFDNILAVAEAMRSGATQAIDAVIETQRQLAHVAAGRAENAIQYAAALGRIDEAIEWLNAYYFGEPFTVPEVRFTLEQGSYTPKLDRITRFIFTPPLKAVRADPRFDTLVGRLGLRRYWQQSSSLPDYLRKGVG